MSKCFMMVGVTPQACANALAWYLRSDIGPEITEIHFITSWDEGKPSQNGLQNVLEVHELSKDIAQRLVPDAFERIEFKTDNIIWIPEADLPSATSIMARALLERCPLGSDVVIDITAGRKMMTSSAVVAALLLHQKFKRNVFISYYLLHEFSKENLRKRAYELGLDDAETVIINVDDLDAEIRKVDEQSQDTDQPAE